MRDVSAGGGTLALCFCLEYLDLFMFVIVVCCAVRDVIHLCFCICSRVSHVFNRDFCVASNLCPFNFLFGAQSFPVLFRARSGKQQTVICGEKAIVAVPHDPDHEQSVNAIFWSG